MTVVFRYATASHTRQPTTVMKQQPSTTIYNIQNIDFDQGYLKKRKHCWNTSTKFSENRATKGIYLT